VHTQIAYNGHKYTGDFEDSWPIAWTWAVKSHTHVVLKTDGKETASVKPLELNGHSRNPDLIFPVPPRRLQVENRAGPASGLGARNEIGLPRDFRAADFVLESARRI